VEAANVAGMTTKDWIASERARLGDAFNASDYGFVAPGVIVDNDGKTRPNDIPVDPETYWKAVAQNVQSPFVYDNSYVKCREITFGYTFPENMLAPLKIVKSLSLSFVARNPFIIWKNIPNIGPDSGYNTSGFGLEYGSLPSRRSYGFNVNVKF
jgi:hypothetical protein